MTVEVVKFNAWKVPRSNRLDPFELRLRGGSLQSFRNEGAISAYGTSRRPTDAKTHAVSFVMHKGCEADMLAARDEMLTALLTGEGRLWFNTVGLTAPQMFCMADLNDVVWEASKNDYRFADVSIEWSVYNAILYRPLNSSYITQAGYTPVTVASNVFGESWDERVFASFTVAASPTNFTINNVGHLRSHRVIIRIESLGTNGFVNPRITNNTTGQYFEYIGTGVNSSYVVQANAAIGPHRARLSTDAGASLVNTPETGNIWPNCNINTKQVPIMELDPGANSITVTASGTFPPGFRVMFLWLPAYGMPT